MGCLCKIEAGLLQRLPQGGLRGRWQCGQARSGQGIVLPLGTSPDQPDFDLRPVANTSARAQIQEELQVVEGSCSAPRNGSQPKASCFCTPAQLQHRCGPIGLHAAPNLRQVLEAHIDNI